MRSRGHGMRIADRNFTSDVPAPVGLVQAATGPAEDEEAGRSTGDRRLLAPFRPGTDDLLALVGDGIVCTEQSGRIILFNRAAESLFGYTEQEVLGRPVEMLMPEHQRASHREEVGRFARSSDAQSRRMGHRREIVGRRRDGAEFPLEATLSRLAIDGRTVLTVVVRDISERRRAEEERRLVASELAHRMKNVMAVVSSVVVLAGRGSRSVDTYRDAIQGRLAAIARASDILVGGSLEGASLQCLIEAQLAPFRDGDGRNIRLSGPPVAIPGSWATTLALIIHELATNAVKHGALGVPAGHVELSWTLGGERQSRLELEWRESGGPPVSAPARRGFGTEVIERSLSRAQGASARLTYAPRGLLCRITLPLEP